MPRYGRDQQRDLPQRKRGDSGEIEANARTHQGNGTSGAERLGGTGSTSDQTLQTLVQVDRDRNYNHLIKRDSGKSNEWLDSNSNESTAKRTINRVNAVKVIEYGKRPDFGAKEQPSSAVEKVLQLLGAKASTDADEIGLSAGEELAVQRQRYAHRGSKSDSPRGDSKLELASDPETKAVSDYRQEDQHLKPAGADFTQKHLQEPHRQAEQRETKRKSNHGRGR